MSSRHICFRQRMQQIVCGRPNQKQISLDALLPGEITDCVTMALQYALHYLDVLT